MKRVLSFGRRFEFCHNEFVCMHMAQYTICRHVFFIWWFKSRNAYRMGLRCSYVKLVLVCTTMIASSPVTNHTIKLDINSCASLWFEFEFPLKHTDLICTVCRQRQLIITIQTNDKLYRFTTRSHMVIKWCLKKTDSIETLYVKFTRLGLK